jgi:WD40 repeat protein
VLALATEGTLKLFVGKEPQPRTIKPENIAGYDLGISPDGGTLALQTSNEIQLVDLRRAERSRIIRVVDQGQLPCGIQFSVDGTLLAASWSDYRVRLLDVATGKQFAELFVADRYDPLAVFSPDGRYLVVAADRRTLLYELRAPQVRSTVAVQAYPVKAVDFTPDGRTLLVSSERSIADHVVESQLTFWDVTSGRAQRTAKVFAKPADNVRYVPLPGAVAVHPRGDMVASVSSLLGGYLVPIRNRAVGVPLVECPDFEGALEVPLQALQFVGEGVELRDDERASQGRALRIPGAIPGAGVRFRVPAKCFQAEVDGWAVVASIRVERKGLIGPAFTATMRASSNEAWPDTIDLYPIPDGEYHFHLCHFAHRDHRSFDWMEMTLAVPEKNTAVEALWVERVFLVPINIRSWPDSLAVPRQELLRFAPAGDRLWGVVNKGEVVSWQVPDFKVATRWEDAIGDKLFGFKHMNCLSAGDRWVVVGTEGGVCHLLAASSGQREASWPSHGGSIRAVALDPSETVVALGTQKGHLRLLSVPGGEVVADLPRHAQSVEAVVFSRDGRLLVTASLDQTVRLWRKTATGFQPLLTLNVPSGRITSVRLSPDQTRLAIVTDPDRGVHLWHLDQLKSRLDALGVGW